MGACFLGMLPVVRGGKLVIVPFTGTQLPMVREGEGSCGALFLGDSPIGGELQAQ